MKALLLALLSVAITSCAVGPSYPDAAKTEHMEVMAAGATRKGNASGKPYGYHVALRFKGDFKVPVYAKASFENPWNGSEPIVVTKRITERDMVVIESPGFSKPPEKKLMSVHVELYKDAARRQKLDELNQQFVVTLLSDQKLRNAGLGHLVD